MYTVQLVYIMKYLHTCAYIYNVYTIRIQYTLYLSMYIYIFVAGFPKQICARCVSWVPGPGLGCHLSRPWTD